MRIALLAGRPYLSDKIYSRLADRFSGDELIYLDDSGTNAENRNIGVPAKNANRPRFPCEYHDFSIPIRPFGEGRFREKVLRWRRELQKVSRFLDSLRLDAAVTCTDMSMTGRLLGEWASSRGKPYIVMQAGLIDNQKLEKPIIFEERVRYLLFNRCLSIPKYKKQRYWGGEISRAEILLWGDAYRLPYRGYRRVHCIGNPAYDGLYSNDPGPRGKAVLLCTQPCPASAEIAEVFRIIAQKKKDTKFIIKIHPRIRESVWAEQLGGLENVEIVEDGSVAALFPDSMIQISINSGTTLEAILYGLPIICLVHPRREINLISGTPDFGSDFYEGIAEYAVFNDSEEIAEKIDQVIQGGYYKDHIKRRREFIEKKLFSLDDQATARAEEIIRRSIVRSREGINA
jgi:hypothetical protein